MRPHRLRQKLGSGDLVTGVLLRSGSLELLAVCAEVGAVFALVDLESGYLVDSAEALVRAGEMADLPVIFGVPRNDAPLILRYLETGAAGVEIPVTSAADAEAAVLAVKYFPRGRRGLAAVRAADQGVLRPMAEYMAHANEQTFVSLRLDSVRALESLPGILDVADVDLLHLDAKRVFAASQGRTEAMEAMKSAVHVIADRQRVVALDTEVFARKELLELGSRCALVDPLEWTRSGARSWTSN